MALEFFLRSCQRRHFLAWVSVAITVPRLEARRARAICAAERRVVVRQRQLISWVFLRWRSETEASRLKLKGLQQSAMLWLTAAERSRKFRRLRVCWSHWRSLQLHGVELRLEKLRKLVDSADRRADDTEVKASAALSTADAALWQVCDWFLLAFFRPSLSLSLSLSLPLSLSLSLSCG
jgi:hypothetical protein